MMLRVSLTLLEALNLVPMDEGEQTALVHESPRPDMSHVSTTTTLPQH